MQNTQVITDLEQGTDEWLLLRKQKITATDANAIMGSPWKTPLQLYNEKLSNEPPTPPNERMLRGLDLESIARDLFNLKTGLNMQPAILVDGWRMASLDGRDEKTGSIVEIKCPGEKDHAIALSGKVPDHYYAQVQWQILLAETDMAYYFSYDGFDGVIVMVERDEAYIKKMLTKCSEFYENLVKMIPPKPSEKDYVEREDALWQEYAKKWADVSKKIKELEAEELALRNQLIMIGNDQNNRGAGVTLCRIERKGNVEYAKIPELKSVNLDAYRKEPIITWRVTSE